MIALALFAVLAQQDTNTALSPRVRAMIERFPPPRPGEPSIAIRFSRDTVWVGEQVELVTGAWFPRQLRDRLRHQPTIRAPSLSGLWSARNQQVPIQASTRFVGNQVYDLYLAYQVIFPLGPGVIDAPPAVLNFKVPTSTSYFAPEESRTYTSAGSRVVVRGVPTSLAAALGTGPTARNLRIAWRSPAEGIRAGAPAIVQLVVSGEGNLTLWPSPQIVWPAAVHVYPEPTAEVVAPIAGIIAGEKRFRFTVVVDSAGVLSLPAVSYPYFDAGSVSVRPAVAAALALPILPRPVGANDRTPPILAVNADVPVATTLVHSWWPALLVVALLPVIAAGWQRRPPPVIAPRGTADPESALRAALGTPVDAGPDHVIAALRRRGVPRDEAEHVRRWLSATARRRYGPGPADSPEPPPVLARILARVRRRVGGAVILVALVAGHLRSQAPDGAERFAGGDYAGAARAFAVEARAHPHAVGAWRNLGAARWMQGDDAGAAAALIQGLRLAPRDPDVRALWQRDTTVPPDVRALAPGVPLSRDELVLLALACWMAGAVAVLRGWRRTAWGAGAILAGAVAVAASRWHDERTPRALIVAATPLRISPHAATQSLADLAPWALVRVRRRDQNWILVDTELSSPGSVGALDISGWVPAASVAVFGPLD